MSVVTIASDTASLNISPTERSFTYLKIQQDNEGTFRISIVDNNGPFPVESPKVVLAYPKSRGFRKLGIFKLLEKIRQEAQRVGYGGVRFESARSGIERIPD